MLYDLMLQRDGRELLYLPLLDYSACNLDAVREMLVHPATVLGLGDGGAHCGVLCDASLPTFMLTHWARDRSRGERLPSRRWCTSRRGARPSSTASAIAACWRRATWPTST